MNIITEKGNNDIKIPLIKLCLTKLKLNHTVAPIENPIKIRDTRKTVARLATELTERNKASK